MTRQELLERWVSRRDEFQRLRASVDGATICEQFLSDLEILAADEDAPVNLTTAAAVSGYTQDHLSRLVSSGALKNYGRKHAPRVRLSECPRKPAGEVARGRQKQYDPATDARSLVGSRR